MRNLKVEDNEMIYQIADVIEGHEVIVDITYSGDTDEDGNEILEFECAAAEEETNPTLSKDELRIVNKILECGLEERYVVALQEHYKTTSIKFDVGEYKHSPISILYDTNTETENH
jgi:hypothetical protein